MTPSPLTLHTATVLPAWIDYNGHMNVAYYLLAFDQATDAVLDRFEIGRHYVETAGRSLFVVDAHLTYQNEVTEGEQLRFASYLLGADGKRLHLFHEMYAADGTLAATAEFMMVHVDMSQRRSTPFPQPVAEALAAAVLDHAALPRPDQAGRAVRRIDG